MTRQNADVESVSIPPEAPGEPETSRGHIDDGLALMPFVRELQDVATQIEQGAGPVLYQRLRLYYDALRMAQAVVIAFQRQRASDSGERS